MTRKQYQTACPWQEKKPRPLYPLSDRQKHLCLSNRVLCRALQVNLNATDTNLLFDSAQRCRTERLQPFMGNKQVTYF